MNKVIGYRLWVVVILLFVFLLPTTTYLLQPTYAAESSPSADIKSKLEELKKEIASKAAQLKLQVNRKLKDKAYIGKIKTKSDSSLTLATKTGPKIVSINQDTLFENDTKLKKKVSLKTLTEEDYVAALGDIDEAGVLTARTIILSPQPPEQQKTFLWGQIISVTDQLVTLKGKDFKNTAVSLPSGASVKLNNFVILTGNKNKNDLFKAEFVYVIPQGGIIKPKKVATPSASLKPNTSKTATKSATPKPVSH